MYLLFDMGNTITLELISGWICLLFYCIHSRMRKYNEIVTLFWERSIYYDIKIHGIGLS